MLAGMGGQSVPSTTGAPLRPLRCCLVTEAPLGQPLLFGARSRKSCFFPRPVEKACEISPENPREKPAVVPKGTVSLGRRGKVVGDGQEERGEGCVGKNFLLGLSFLLPNC